MRLQNTDHSTMSHQRAVGGGGGGSESGLLRTSEKIYIPAEEQKRVSGCGFK